MQTRQQMKNELKRFFIETANQLSNSSWYIENMLPKDLERLEMLDYSSDLFTDLVKRKEIKAPSNYAPCKLIQYKREFDRY